MCQCIASPAVAEQRLSLTAQGKLRNRLKTAYADGTTSMFEEVVGEIDVGYDFDEYHPKKRIYIEHENENTHLMSGCMPISETNDILYAQFPVEEAHSIGGLIVARLRRIPKEGDTIEEQGYKITVVEANN